MRKAKFFFGKPLVHDLKSSIAINNTISAAFKEGEIFRIDCYLMIILFVSDLKLLLIRFTK